MVVKWTSLKRRLQDNASGCAEVSDEVCTKFLIKLRDAGLIKEVRDE